MIIYYIVLTAIISAGVSWIVAYKMLSHMMDLENEAFKQHLDNCDQIFKDGVVAALIKIRGKQNA